MTHPPIMRVSGGDSSHEFHPHHQGNNFAHPEGMGDEALNENFHALLYAQDKSVREKVEFWTKKMRGRMGTFLIGYRTLRTPWAPRWGPQVPWRPW